MSDRFRYGLLRIDKTQTSGHFSAMFTLHPVLGNFTLDPENPKADLVGGRNSTRWILEIIQPAGPVESLRFWLVRGFTIQTPELISFSFGPHTSNFYEARPTLEFLPRGGLELRALASNEPVRYQLSLDVMHSMFR